MKLALRLLGYLLLALLLGYGFSAWLRPDNAGWLLSSWQSCG